MLSLENFLDKDDKRKFDFVRLLEESSELSELNTTIQAQLSLSTFLFNKTIEELRQDFATYDLEHFFAIETDNVQTTLLEAGQATSDLLLTHYLRDSLSFAIVVALFIGDFQSTQSFADDHFTSYTSVYSRVRQIKQLLQDFDVEIDKQHHIVGAETNIRYLLTRMFAFVLADDAALYSPTVQTAAGSMIASLETRVTLPHTVQTKLRHFIQIALVREAAGYQLSLGDANRQKVMGNLWSLYAEEAALIGQFPVSLAVQQEILAFLYVSGLLPAAKMDQQSLGQHLSRLSHRFLSAATAAFGLKDPALQTRLMTELNRVHFELIYFPLNAFYSFERFDMTFFKDSYTEYFEFCRTYLMDEDFLRAESFLSYRPYVFYRYLMILVSTIQLDAVMEPIIVCVDFSFGQEYNNFIKKNFALFVNLNVNVQFMYDEHTDVVVTNLNSAYDDFDVEKVIWLDPPRAIDWAHLSDRILEIRATKTK